MTKLVIRPRAKRELADIWLHTADNWGIDQADTYVRQIAQAIERTLEFPEAGSPVAGHGEEYRKVRSGSHRAIYRLTEADVIVVRIIHEREDVPDDLE